MRQDFYYYIVPQIDFIQKHYQFNETITSYDKLPYEWGKVYETLEEAMLNSQALFDYILKVNVTGCLIKYENLYASKLEVIEFVDLNDYLSNDNLLIRDYANFVFEIEKGNFSKALEIAIDSDNIKLQSSAIRSLADLNDKVEAFKQSMFEEIREELINFIDLHCDDISQREDLLHEILQYERSHQNSDRVLKKLIEVSDVGASLQTIDLEDALINPTISELLLTHSSEKVVKAALQKARTVNAHAVELIKRMGSLFSHEVLEKVTSDDVLEECLHLCSFESQRAIIAARLKNEEKAIELFKNDGMEVRAKLVKRMSCDNDKISFALNDNSLLVITAAIESISDASLIERFFVNHPHYNVRNIAKHHVIRLVGSHY